MEYLAIKDPKVDTIELKKVGIQEDSSTIDPNEANHVEDRFKAYLLL